MDEALLDGEFGAAGARGRVQKEVLSLVGGRRESNFVSHAGLELVRVGLDSDVFEFIVAGQKTEHYEIAASGNLALIADRLGKDEAGDLLHETLEEEEDALDELATLVDEYDYEQFDEASTAD